MQAPLPLNEEERLVELSCFGVLDTPPELMFDRVTRIAARVFQMPIALVSLVDRDRQWYKSNYGLDFNQTARSQSFCTHAILASGTMVVPDALQDVRFAGHSLVRGEPFIRFYAGAPLITPRGYCLGTLCVSDHEPRQFGAENIAVLEDLAAMVVHELELRRDSTRSQHEIERRKLADHSVRATHDELKARVQEHTAARADAEARYRSLFENAVSGIYQSLPGKAGFLNVNPAFASILGYPSPEVLIATVKDLDAVYVRAGRRAELQRRLEAEGIVIGVESEIHRSDGAHLWISENTRAIRDDQGRILRYEGTVEDITVRRTIAEALQRAHEELEDRVHERTAELALFNGTLRQQIAERERAEENARRSESKFRALIENAQDLTSLVAPEGVILYLSPSAEHILGYSSDDLVGRDAFTYTIHPADRDMLRAEFARIVEEASQYVRFEARFLHRDGSWKLLESIASCAPPDFPIVSLIINSRDITERRRHELAHEAQIRQQTAVAELGRYALQGPDLAAIFDKAANLITGALEVSFSTVAELLPGEDRLLIRAARGWQQPVVGQTVVSGRTLAPDGKWLDREPMVIPDLHQERWRASVARGVADAGPVSGVSVVIQSAGQPFGALSALSSIVRDFTPQDVTFMQTIADLLSTLIDSRRQEAVSREVEARYQIIVSNVPGVVYQWGRRPDGTSFLAFISEGCRQIYETDAATLRSNPALLGEMIHPDDRPSFDAVIDQSARTLEAFEWEGRLRVPSGDTRWITARSRPGRQSNGDILWDGVLLDVSELKRAQDTMREAKEEAEKANRAKSEFLSRTSHELRTPLNAILGFGQLLSLEQLSAVQASSVEQILKGGRHLLDLINEVLDIARIEAGSMEMTLDHVEAAPALAEAALFTRALAEQHGVRFVSQVPAGCALAVTADRGRLLQVLLNLLSNAVKYNHEGGEVRFTCEPSADGENVRFSISDTGPGLQPDEATRLFVPFQRLSAPHRGIPGTGIGLTITKSLVEAMDGAVGVETVPGEGCTFFVDLPVSLGSAPSTLSTSADDVRHSPAHLPALRTILHIDDQSANLTLVERMLEMRSDLRLLNASDGRAGLAIAREQRPDVILLDLHLPDLPGEEVARRLHHEPRTRQIPVVVLSADATPGQIARLSQLGVREYITKPFKIPSLLRSLDALLALAPSAPPDFTAMPPVSSLSTPP